VNMQRTVSHPAGPSYEAVTLSQSDWDDYTQGKVFFVAYASISYSDFFRVEPSGVTSKPASRGHFKTGQLSASRTPCFYPSFDRSGKLFCI